MEDDLIKARDFNNLFYKNVSHENKFQELFFKYFNEGNIEFQPTYKYDIGTDTFDTSKKQRVPAYCDRILWKLNDSIEQLYYKSIPEIKYSDHKPVLAYFRLKINQKNKPTKVSSGLQNSVGEYFLKQYHSQIMKDETSNDINDEFEEEHKSGE